MTDTGEIAHADEPEGDLSRQPTNRSTVRGRLRNAVRLEGASSAALWTLFGLNLVDEFDRIAFATLTPELRDAFDLTDEQIVAVGQVSAIFVLLAAIPVGYLVDRVPRVRMARVAALVWGSMALLLGLAWSVLIVFAARFFSGIAKSSNEIVHTGLLADYYEPRHHPKVFQIHKLANPLSYASAIVVGVASEAFGWRWAFVLLAVPTFVLLARMARLREPLRGETLDPDAARLAEAQGPKPPGYLQATRSLVRIRTLRRLWVGFVILGMAGLALGQLLSLFFEQVYGFGPAARGLMSFLYGAGQVGGMLIGGALGSKLAARNDVAGLMKLAAAGLGTIAVSVTAMGVAPWAIVSALASMVLAGGVGLLLPTLPVLIVRVAPPQIRGQAHSFTMVAVAVGALFAVPVTGLADDRGYRLAFVVLGAIIVLAAVVVWTAHRLIEADANRMEAGFRRTTD